MHSCVAKPIREIVNLLNTEVIKMKHVDAEQFRRFTELFNIETDDFKLYLNGSLIVFDNPIVFEALQYSIDPDSIVSRIEMPEYNIHVFVIRWLKEFMIKEALDLHDVSSESIIIEGEEELS